MLLPDADNDKEIVLTKRPLLTEINDVATFFLPGKIDSFYMC